jgi:hypothetical protein
VAQTLQIAADEVTNSWLAQSNVRKSPIATKPGSCQKCRLKNISKPVRAYAALVGAHSAPTERLSAASPLPVKPSIAVLPFENMSGDPEQEYFADGMVEEIITALSRSKSLFVIARNSSITFNGRLYRRL